MYLLTQLHAAKKSFIFRNCLKRIFLALISGHEAEVEGTLSVQPQANPVKGFEDYFLNLTVQSNTRNPWFVGKSLN